MTNDSKNDQKPIIAVCVSKNSSSLTALKYACYKAKRVNFSVHIVAVMESDDFKGLLFVSDVVKENKRQEIEDHINKIIDIASHETKIMPSISIREGEITQEIIDEMKNNPNYSLLVFGKSIKSMSNNTVLPKITNEIADKIKVPVVIVPDNLDDDFLKKLV